MNSFTVEHSSWASLPKETWQGIQSLRGQVFSLEQRVDPALDFDGKDQLEDTEHWWISGSETGLGANDDADAVSDAVPSTVIAYLRLTPAPASGPKADLAIGRVAVAGDSRGKGLAGALIETVLAANPSARIVLHSQLYVCGLYEKFGFVIVGEPYEQAGMKHVTMMLIR